MAVRKMNFKEDDYAYAMSKVSKWYAKDSEQRRPFCVLIIGVTGSGKSTLINSLLGEDIAEVGWGVQSKTESINKHKANINGISIVVYDTPGLLDTRSEGLRDQETLREIETLIRGDGISLTIFCFKITETRLTPPTTECFEEYHRLGLPWKKTIIALTFADQITKADGPLYTHVEKWRKAVCEDILVKKLRLTNHTADQIPFRPTAKCPSIMFPGGGGWFARLWYSVLQILEPEAMVSFLMTRNKYIREEKKTCIMKDGLDGYTLQFVVDQYNKRLTIRIKKVIFEAAKVLGLLSKDREEDFLGDCPTGKEDGSGHHHTDEEHPPYNPDLEDSLATIAINHV